MVGLVPQTGRDGAVEGQCHDEHQTGEPVGVLDLRVLGAEAARLEVGEHRLDPPAPGTVQRGETAGLLRQGDDPRLVVAWVADDADEHLGAPRRGFDVIGTVSPLDPLRAGCRGAFALAAAKNSRR